MVKPGTEGSALGVFIVEGAAAIGEAIEKAFDIDSEVLVERYIKGKELTVAVIGNDNPRALPIIEIVPVNDFYDYEAKYKPGASQHLCPAPLSEETTRQIQNMAGRIKPSNVQAFRDRTSFWMTKGTGGYSRRTPSRA